MREIKEMLSTMKAYMEGMKIEVYEKNDGMWYDCDEPLWDWFNEDYRVKKESPKQKIIPYESAREFIAAVKEHGPMIKLSTEDEDGWFTYMIPLNVDNDNTVWLSNHDAGAEEGTSFDFLIDNKYSWQDGTPCGKEVCV